MGGMSERKRLKRIRQAVIKRDGSVCCYCNKILTEDLITMEHIIPVSMHGSYNSTNLTVACYSCNHNRGTEPFLEFIKMQNFSEEKIAKYQTLYLNNLKIKVLNTAKKFCINNYDVPQSLIDQACKQLQVVNINYDEYTDKINISMNSFHKKNKIILNFENIIHLIEGKK